jgi:hypothetical protein
MTRLLLTAAAVAAIAISGAAFAEDGKAKSTAPQAMSDSEMDRVTAGTVQRFGTPGTSNYQINLPSRANEATGANVHGNAKSSGQQPPNLF